MRPERHALIATAVSGMRAPLSRIELAASQLDRAGATPLTHSLCGGIREAVAQLDRQIEASLRALLPQTGTRRAQVPCQPALADLCRHLGPVLEARGITCSIDSGCVVGDPERICAGALALVRSGGALAAGGGSIHLELCEERDRYGLRIRAAAVAPVASQEQIETIVKLDAVQRFALAHDAELDASAEPGKGWLATLWFRDGGFDP